MRELYSGKRGRLQLTREEAVNFVRKQLYDQSAKMTILEGSFVQEAVSPAKKCTEETCKRQIYAKGLCNAHYMRKLNNIPKDFPVRNRKRLDKCMECEKPLNGKGGWSLCQSHYNKRRARTIKASLVKILGGKCNRCFGRFSDPCFDFHHLGNKDDSLSSLIRNGNIEAMVDEIQKCVLLCANCHRELHYEF